MVANPTPPSDSLQILITPDPASTAQPACTPELAALLFQRWPDAMIVFDQAAADRWRWLYLPDLRRRRLARSAAERVLPFAPPNSARTQAAVSADIEDVHELRFRTGAGADRPCAHRAARRRP